MKDLRTRSPQGKQGRVASWNPSLSFLSTGATAQYFRNADVWKHNKPIMDVGDLCRLLKLQGGLGATDKPLRFEGNAVRVHSPLACAKGCSEHEKSMLAAAICGPDRLIHFV